jgi:hypothetical protein
VEVAGAFGPLSPKDSKTVISSRPEIGVRSEIEQTIAMNEHEILQSFRHNSDGMRTPLKTVAIAGDNNHFQKGPTWGIVGGLEKVCLWSPRLSCLVPLASRSWPHTSGRADWGFLVRQPRWPRAIGKATFGKAMSGTPYSPSSSGWFGFTARKHPCPEAAR